MQSLIDVLRNFFGKASSFIYWLGRAFAWFLGSFLKSVSGTIFIIFISLATVIKFIWSLTARIIEAFEAADIAANAAVGSATGLGGTKIQTTSFMEFMNYILPLEEFFNLTITFIGVVLVCVSYRFIKKWIPGLAT